MTPRGEKMDRRGAGMAPMMPFFTGPTLGDQGQIPPPDMPPFPHMRERFPNAVWGPGEAPPQGQWGAFHPPGLAPPPNMAHPAHPTHQFTQFEPRQGPMFNFPPGTAPPPGSAVPVSQYNNGFNGQYTNGDTVPAYVPQGHFSPQTGPTSTPQSYANGPTNGYLPHSQGNGLVGGASPHQHPYPAEYQHPHPNQQPQTTQQQPNQQGMFKSPLSSPAVSAPEASPVSGGYTMSSLPSPHHGHPQQQQQQSQPQHQQQQQHPQLACRGPPSAGSNYSQQIQQDSSNIALPPQASPHNNISSTTTSVNSNTNNSSVQSRLKNMIMSRQGGGSAFSPGPGLTESPPLGELRFSGSVAAVTSVSSTDVHMQESLKMAQNFLACRTTESGPDSVVRPISSDDKGGDGAVTSTAPLVGEMSQKSSTLSLDNQNNKTSCPPTKRQKTLNSDNAVTSSAPDKSTEDEVDCGVSSSSQDAAVNGLGPEPPDPGTLPSSTVNGRPTPSTTPLQTPVTTSPVCSASALAALHNTNVPSSKDLSMYDFPDSPEEKASLQKPSQNGSDFRSGRVRGLGPRTSRPTCARANSTKLTLSTTHLPKDVGTEAPIANQVTSSNNLIPGCTPHNSVPNVSLGSASLPRNDSQCIGKSSVCNQNDKSFGNLPNMQFNSRFHGNAQSFSRHPSMRGHYRPRPSGRGGMKNSRMQLHHQQMQNFPNVSLYNAYTAHCKSESYATTQHYHNNFSQQSTTDVPNTISVNSSCSAQSQCRQDQYIQSPIPITTTATSSSIPQTTMVSNHPNPTAVAQSNRNDCHISSHSNDGSTLAKDLDANRSANINNSMYQQPRGITFLPGSLEQKYAPIAQTEPIKNSISSLEALKTRLQEQYLEAKGISPAEAKERNLLVPGQYKSEQYSCQSYPQTSSVPKHKDFVVRTPELTPTSEDVKPDINQWNLHKNMNQQLGQRQTGMQMPSKSPLPGAGQLNPGQNKTEKGLQIKQEPTDNYGPTLNPSATGTTLNTSATADCGPIPATAHIKEEPNDPEAISKEKRKMFLKMNELLVPQCTCVVPSDAPDCGPIYSHLGAATTLKQLREKVESVTGFKGPEVRIEKITYTGKEGKTDGGCPLPKWIIRRAGPTEKVLVIAKNRKYHVCEASWIVVAQVAWEGIPLVVADDLYSMLVYKLNRYGQPTERRCGTNDDRTCICQGLDKDKCGASFSFGCSWSMYYNMCKFARSRTTRKFKLLDEEEEKEVEYKLQQLATDLAPLYQRIAPIAYANQIGLEEESLECRLGNREGRPWTGVTACLDFCAHSHKDKQNMNNGSTVVATLTKHRGFEKPDDEQLHVLPLYVIDSSEDPGESMSFKEKVDSGAIEVLTKYPCEIRLRSEPLLSCRARNLLARGLPLPRGAMRGRGRGRGRGKSKSASTLIDGVTKKRNLNDPMDSIIKVGIKNLGDKYGFDFDDLGDATFGQFTDFGSDFDISDELNQLMEEFENDRKNDENFNKSNYFDNILCGTESGQNDNSGTGLDTSADNTAPTIPPTSQQDPTSLNTVKTAPESNVFPSNMPPPASPAPKKINSPASSPLSSRAPTPQIPTSPLSCPSPMASPNMSQHPILPSKSSAEITSSGSMPISPNISCGSVSMPQISPLSSCDSPHHSIHSQSPTYGNSPRGHGNMYNQNLMMNPQGYPYMGNTMMDNPMSSPNSQSFPNSPAQSGNFNPSLGCSSMKNPMMNPNPYANYMGNPYTPGYSPEHEQYIHKEPQTILKYSDNMESFNRPNVGGVAIALSHGSVLFECAKHELHATTALKNPDRRDPKRISLVFYQHKSLIYRNHGLLELEEKMEKKRSEDERLIREGKMEPSPRKKKKMIKDGFVFNEDGSITQTETPLIPNPTDPVPVTPVTVKKQRKSNKESKVKRQEQLFSSQYATVYPQEEHKIPNHPDLIPPPISYATNYNQNLPSFVDRSRTFSPSGEPQRFPYHPTFSMAGTPHSTVTTQSPSPYLTVQNDRYHMDHPYHMNMHQQDQRTQMPPFNTAIQEFNPYNTPTASPYNSPIMTQTPQQSPFCNQQQQYMYPKIQKPVNSMTTSVPESPYGLTPPYSPGSQQMSQQQLQYGMQYDGNMINTPPTHTTSTYSQLRHSPMYVMHGPYSPWSTNT